MIKYFRFSFEYVLWGISWANLTLLMATIPRYESAGKKAADDEKDVENLDELAGFLNL